MCHWFGVAAGAIGDVRVTAEEGGCEGAACSDGGDHEERACVAVSQCGSGAVSVCEALACCR